MWGWSAESEEKAPAAPAKSARFEAKDDAKLRAENEELKRELARLKSKAVPSPAKPAPSPMKEASNALPPKAGLRVGDLMVVAGLVKRAELNGRLARVLAHDPAKDTWSAQIEGEAKRFALKAANLEPQAKGTATYQPASLFAPQSTPPKKKKAMTTRSGSPRKATDSVSSVGGEASGASAVGTSRKTESREEVRQRLYAPLPSRPPRDKAAVTEKAAAIDYFDSGLSIDGSPSSIDERPPFVVPLGRRRTRTAASRTNHTERLNRDKPTTARGSRTTWAQVKKLRTPSHAFSPFPRLPAPSTEDRKQLRSGVGL